jgi:hypothetical protein
VTRAHPLIERVFGALEWLAMYPPYSLEPIHAHDYWLVDEAWLAN